jgi:anti-sigma factor RsiW
LLSSANTAEGHDMTNQDLHELTSAYALDALDADDREAFETHLRECERCRAELGELAETVGALAYASEGPAPPESLRDRILVAAREEGPSNVVAIRPKRTRLYAGVALAAAAAVAIAIGLTTGLTGGGPSKRIALSGDGRIVTVSGFDAVDSGRVWTLWVIDGAGPHRAGVFVGGQDAVVKLTRRATPGSTVAVTAERSPTATTPTPPIYAPTVFSA